MAWELIINSFFGILAGMIIGIERQWQKKLAGMKTTTLVCFGACLFVTLSMLITDDGSPTRIAAQVVSGIGFLAGGVIIRDGYSVSGINTAATVWCSAAVGVIIGAGFKIEGILCALILMSINIFLSSASRKVDTLSIAHHTDPKHFYLSVTCLEKEEIHVRTVILNDLNQLQLNFNQIICGEAEKEKVTILIDLERSERDYGTDLRMKHLVERLLLEKTIMEVQILGPDRIE